MGNDGSMDPITAQGYVEALRRQGKKAFLEKDCVFWQESERLALERHPLFCPDVPSPRDIRSLLWRSRFLVATYVMPVDDAHPGNSWLYLCENRDYSLENLSSPARRDARRALRAFRYEFIDSAAVLTHGTRAFCDTRARVGLSDGTPQLFQKYAESLIANPAYQFVGAWCGDELAAYLWMLRVDDWAAVGAYAANDHLRSCPNNGLLHFALDHCLAQGRCRVVSYGLSSIQEVNRTATLDYFKKKVGFEARPVHREFQFHPLLGPLVNPLTYWIVRGGSRAFPHNRTLRKAAGMLAASLGKAASMETPAVALSNSQPGEDREGRTE
jgi:hypothetical protein